MTWIPRILFSLFFSVLPALPFYFDLLDPASKNYQMLLSWRPIIIGILLILPFLSLFILVFYLYDRAERSTYINKIIFNAALEGIDQNPDSKSYTNKENRVLDALKKNPNLSSKGIDKIMKENFPTWPVAKE